jgi:ADP-dependent NAD(P)H-hydrate dehydratase / NAD(P)H-hydrate epimerase
VVVIGPGIGRDSETRDDVRKVVEASPVPVVVDADGLFALGSAADVLEVSRRRRPEAGAIVLTPHAGEFKQMFGRAPGVDRVREAMEASESTGCIVLLKGSTTVVAGPRATTGGATARVVTSGGPNLATAGTGDVLSGAIAAFIARGTDPLEAAALAAHAHGRAAGLGPAVGLVAGDLADLLARWLSRQVPKTHGPHQVPQVHHAQQVSEIHHAQQVSEIHHAQQVSEIHHAQQVDHG